MSQCRNRLNKWLTVCNLNSLVAKFETFIKLGAVDFFRSGINCNGKLQTKLTGNFGFAINYAKQVQFV